MAGLKGNGRRGRAASTILQRGEGINTDRLVINWNAGYIVYYDSGEHDFRMRQLDDLDMVDVLNEVRQKMSEGFKVISGGVLTL